MVQLIVGYPDGRQFQTTDEGFAANHEPFGATVVGYVGLDGQRRPATAAGKRAAEEAVDPTDTPVTRQTAALQAEAAVAAAPDEGYAAMTVADLRALTDKLGIAVPSGAKKADLIAALTEADEAPPVRTLGGES